MKKIPRLALILVIIFANIGCDQITKDLARKNLEYHETVEVLGEYLILTKVENQGAFLGMGSTLPPALRTILLLILPSIVMVAVFVYLIRNKDISPSPLRENRSNIVHENKVVGISCHLGDPACCGDPILADVLLQDAC